MSTEHDKLKLRIKQAEAAETRARTLYNEAEPGPAIDAFSQLVVAEKASVLAKGSGASKGDRLNATACSNRCARTTTAKTLDSTGPLNVER